MVFSRSYLHRLVSPPETLVVKGGTTWARNGRWILPENARLPRNIQGSLTCRRSTTYDRRLYFPSEGRRAEDFFALKNPTASVGFEPANLGTKDHHISRRYEGPYGLRPQGHVPGRDEGTTILRNIDKFSVNDPVSSKKKEPVWQKQIWQCLVSVTLLQQEMLTMCWSDWTW